MKILCYCDFFYDDRAFFFGDEMEFRSVSEDDLNYYAHGVNSNPYPGISSNYLVLPKHSFSRIT